MCVGGRCYLSRRLNRRGGRVGGGHVDGWRGVLLPHRTCNGKGVRRKVEYDRRLGEPRLRGRVR